MHWLQAISALASPGFGTSGRHGCFPYPRQPNYCGWRLASRVGPGQGVWPGTAQRSSVSGLGNLGSVWPLPVTLVPFTATAQAAAALLTWITASETNNAGFEVQSSRDGVSFQTLAFVAGTGTTATSHTLPYTRRPAAR